VNDRRIIVRGAGPLQHVSSALRAARRLRARGAVAWIARLPDAGVRPELRPLGGF
jgi:hypothetical protein